MGKFLLESGNWLLYAAPFLPLVIGLLVKSKASTSTKAVVMILINGIAALVYQLQNGDGILTQAMAGAWLYSIVVSVASYYGVWKPLKAGNIAPEVGVG